MPAGRSCGTPHSRRSRAPPGAHSAHAELLPNKRLQLTSHSAFQSSSGRVWHRNLRASAGLRRRCASQLNRESVRRQQVKFRLASLVLFVVAPLAATSSTARADREVEPVRAIEPIVNPKVRYVSTGPSGAGPLLRLTILLSEVYYSVVVEEIFEDPLKEGEPSIESAHLLTGAALGGPLGFSKLTQLGFVRWHSPAEAELANGDMRFILTRTGRGAFSIRRIEH